MKDGKLEAKDLMIGDWVLEGGTIPHKIECLGDGQIDGMMEDCYSPIPLASEILENNGFKSHLRHEYVYRDLEKRIEIRYYQSGGEPSATMDIYKNADTEDEVNYMLPEPYFVNELQRALRVCGLTELADNIKL